METMTAAVLVAHGGPEVLEIRHDVPVPRPGDGEVRIEVAAAGVNNTDLWTREGAYGTPDEPGAVVGWKGVPIDFPRIQGGDAVGRVVELGPGAPQHLLGRRVLVDPIVYGQGDDPEEPPIDGVLGSEEDGAFAQHLCVAAERVHDVTDAPLSDTELACLPIAYGTAIGMLERAAVTAGERVLVTGASGGVGIALVQLAAARGAQVTAVTTARNAVAGPLVRIDLRVLYLQRLRLIGSTMHTPSQFQRLVDEARAGRFSPPVARTFPLEQIHRAQEGFRSGDHVGKLVLLPSRRDEVPA